MLNSYLTDPAEKGALAAPRPGLLEPRFRRAAVSACLLACLVLVVTLPFALSGTPGERIVLLLLINMAAVIGISVYTGNSGILTIGHLGFFAVGAYITGLLTVPIALKADFLPRLPPFLAEVELGLGGSLVIVVLVSAVLGVLTGLPVSRLRDTSAIIATFGLLVIANYVIVGASSLTNGNKAFYGVPQIVGLPTTYVFVFVVIAVAFAFKESRYGLQLRACQDNEVAAAASGIDCNRRLLQAWTLSAVVMGVAGALFAHVIGAFQPRDFYLATTFSLIAMLVVGGKRSISGAVLGTLVVSALVELIKPVESGFSLAGLTLPPLWGLTQISLSLMILVVMYLRPAGLMGSDEFLPRMLARLANGAAERPASPPGTVKKVPAGRTLSTENLGIDFGGVRALNDVSIKITSGKITGLIGPNGAGKTTLINNLTGINRPQRGSVKLGETDLIGWRTDRIALSGLGRTFQNIRLFKDMTVLENVLAAASARGHAEAGIEDYARCLLAQFDLEGDADRKAATLSYGAQRKLEIARALALEPQFLMLDEPAAGMNRIETEQLIQAIRTIRDTFGLGILVVEHDLHLIMRLCDEVFVLNKGERIAAGTAAEVQNDPLVIEAYLGTKEFKAKHKNPA